MGVAGDPAFAVFTALNVTAFSQQVLIFMTWILGLRRFTRLTLNSRPVPRG